MVSALEVRALAGDIVLCSWARHFPLTVPLFTQANLMLGKTLHSHSASLHPGEFNAGGNPAMD